MSQDELRALIKRVQAGLKVTKVVATRSVKGRCGDTFVGFSASWNNVQEDGGRDLVSVGDETDVPQSLNGMTMQEASVACCLVAREADMAAYRNAAAGGNISPEQANAAVAAIKNNYNRMLVNILGAPPPDATNK